jgi:predicted metal-dependent hydrolase
MKETLFIILLIITFYIVFILHDSSLVKFEQEGVLLYVRETNDINDSSKVLLELINKMYRLRGIVINDINRYPDYEVYIRLLEKNFNKNRTKIYETSLDSDYTSYSVNKGEELVFCLRCKKTHELHNINLLMYVAVHEMAHTACPETGHTPLFNKIFKFLLEIAKDNNLYVYDDYSRNPIEYCGMIISSNPYFSFQVER